MASRDLAISLLEMGTSVVTTAMLSGLSRREVWALDAERKREGRTVSEPKVLLAVAPTTRVERPRPAGTSVQLRFSDRPGRAVPELQERGRPQPLQSDPGHVPGHVKKGYGAAALNITRGFHALGPARTCQWMDGEPRERRFCGASSVDGSSWCARHKERVFRPAGEMRDPFAGPRTAGF